MTIIFRPKLFMVKMVILAYTKRNLSFTLGLNGSSIKRVLRFILNKLIAHIRE